MVSNKTDLGTATTVLSNREEIKHHADKWSLAITKNWVKHVTPFIHRNWIVELTPEGFFCEILVKRRASVVARLSGRFFSVGSGVADRRCQKQSTLLGSFIKIRMGLRSSPPRKDRNFRFCSLEA